MILCPGCRRRSLVVAYTHGSDDPASADAVVRGRTCPGCGRRYRTEERVAREITSERPAKRP